LSEMDQHAGVIVIPSRESRTQHVVVNSRFISTIGSAPDIESARLFVSRIKNEFSDASHNVPAYIIGGGNSSIEYCSDDGEPAGTAGRPALTVLRGSGLGNVVLVITRYFGGTKLGKGGLVKAYTESAQLAVNTVPRAQKIKSYNLTVALSYNQLERIRKLVRLHGGDVESEEFTDIVTMLISLPSDNWNEFQFGLSEMSSGRIKAEIVSTAERLIPISSQT
jgi:uncharacterized YigZ family protein